MFFLVLNYVHSAKTPSQSTQPTFLTGSPIVKGVALDFVRSFCACRKTVKMCSDWGAARTQRPLDFAYGLSGVHHWTRLTDHECGFARLAAGDALYMLMSCVASYCVDVDVIIRTRCMSMTSRAKVGDGPDQARPGPSPAGPAIASTRTRPHVTENLKYNKRAARK